MTDKIRLIEIFCEDHGRISKVELKAQIACRITGHYLAFGFPYDRIWEYCCDCEVFQASKLAKGKVAAECRVCRREVARRYMCHNCQTISFESNQPPRGKRQPAIQNTSPDLLQCAGCSLKAGDKNMILHRCPNLGIDFLTTRLDCLFCHRRTSESVVAKNNGFAESKSFSAQAGILSVECPNNRCRNLIPWDSSFCPFCGLRLQRCGFGECGLPLLPTSLFCPYCGTPASDANNRYRRPVEPPAKA